MKKPIFLIDNGADIDELKLKITEFPNSLVFTLDYEIHLLLQKHGISHELGEDILTKDDFNKIDTNSINLTENCFKKFKAELIIENIFNFFNTWMKSMITPNLYNYFIFIYYFFQFFNVFY